MMRAPVLPRALAAVVALFFSGAYLLGCPSSPPPDPPPHPDAGGSSDASISIAPAATTAVVSSAPLLPTAAPAPPPQWDIRYEGGPTPWSKVEGRANVLLSLSGPPGGPLGFSVLDAGMALSASGFEQWVKDQHRPEKPPAAEQITPQTVVLGGQKATAYAYFTGGGLAKSEHCVALWPATKPGSHSLIVSAVAPGSQKTAPTCASVTGHPAIGIVWGSLTIAPR